MNERTNASQRTLRSARTHARTHASHLTSIMSALGPGSGGGTRRLRTLALLRPIEVRVVRPHLEAPPFGFGFGRGHESEWDGEEMCVWVGWVWVCQFNPPFGPGRRTGSIDRSQARAQGAYLDDRVHATKGMRTALASDLKARTPRTPSPLAVMAPIDMVVVGGDIRGVRPAADDGSR